MKATQKTRTDATLPLLLRSFKLPAFVREYGPIAERAAAEGLSHSEYLLALAEVEAAERDARRTARHLEESRLPREKTLGTYDLERLPAKVRTSFAVLRDGSFRRTLRKSTFSTKEKRSKKEKKALMEKWKTQ